MSGDWQCGKSLAECNQYMLDHEVNTDVTFIIDNKDDDNTGSATVHCKAHKYMLVSRSPVFYAMQNREIFEWRMPSQNHSINFLSSSTQMKLNFTQKNIFDILYLSQKYIIPQLTSKCIEYLHSILSPANACLILDQTWIYEDESLIEKCQREIKFSTYAAFKSETMLDISNDTLLKILDYEPLAMTEADVFNACVRWATHQLEAKQVEITGENIRNVLGDCIRKIGYANMGIEVFASVVIPIGVLNVDEENAFFRYMANKQLHSPPENFLCIKRTKIFTMQIMFSKMIGTERIADAIVKVTATCNKDIEVDALVVGGCPGNTKLVNVDFDNNMLNARKEITDLGSKHILKLGSAIVIRKDQEHTFKFTFYNATDAEAGPVFVVKQSGLESVLNGGIVKLRLQSNTTFVPLLGVRGTVSISN